jgi:biopolymer transport protein ExbD
MNFRKHTSIDPTPVQLAPLVDVLFLLVIFFAVTSHFGRMEQVLDISVPASEKKDEKKDARQVGEIIVNIKLNGEIWVNSQVVTVEDLLIKLQNISTVHKDQAVILRGDEGADYKHIIRVLDTCLKAGIWNIAFATRPAEVGS